MNIKTNKVFFSVYQSNRSLQLNAANHDRIKDTLRVSKIPFTEVVGVYNGVKEESLLLQDTDINQHRANLSLAIELAASHNQESVLEVHNDNTGVLIYINDAIRSKKLGTLKQVSREYAETKPGYSFEPKSNTYWIVE